MSSTPWKILETKYVHPGMRVDRCKLPNGQTIDAQVLEYDDEVMIVALTKLHEVVLIRQYRHGLQRSILELPGGSVDKDESPLEAAKRELLEETGYASNTFMEVGYGSPNPAIYTGMIYYFLALDVEQLEHQSHDDGESMELLLMSLDEVVSMAKKRNLTHSLNLSSLFYVLGYLNRIS